MKAITGSKKYLIMFLIVASLIFQIYGVNAKTQDSYLIEAVNMPLINKYGLSISVTFEYELSELIEDGMFLYLFAVYDDISNNIANEPIQFDAAMMFYSDSISSSVLYRLGDPLYPSYWNEGILDVHFSIYGGDVQLSLPEFSALSTESPKMKVFGFISDADFETVLEDFSKILSDYLGEFKLPTNSDVTDTNTESETESKTESKTDDDSDELAFTPGFELLPMIFAASIGIYIKKERK